MDTPDGTYERKIQLTGGTTYTVSLPKEWATAQSIDVGDRVRLYDRGDRLLMTRPDRDEESRSVRISAARCPPAAIARFLTAAYVAGADAVRVEGSPDREDRAAVGDAVDGLVGLEVATETETAIVARAMLDVGDLSPKQTLTQMENATHRMHENAVAAALAGDGTTAGTIRAEDETVDRLFALVAREFQRSLVDVHVDRAGDALTTFDYYIAARQLERIADHAVKIAGAAEAIETAPPSAVAEELDRLAGDARDLVRRALAEALNGRDLDRLGAVITDADVVVDDAETLSRRLHEQGVSNGYALATVVDSITRTAEYGVNIAEAGVQASLRGSETNDVSPTPSQ